MTTALLLASGGECWEGLGVVGAVRLAEPFYLVHSVGLIQLLWTPSMTILSTLSTIAAPDSLSPYPYIQPNNLLIISSLSKLHSPMKPSSPMSATHCHLLQSLLPFDPAPAPTPVPKTKQFYKPEQFIWNNPHRTSSRLYPYYHQQNDNYMKNTKPRIDAAMEGDRSREERDRIRRLREGRDETRRKFLSRQHERLQRSVELGVGRRHSRQESHSYKKLSASYEGQAFTQGITHSTQGTQGTQGMQGKVTASYKSYLEGVANYDDNVQQIKRLFTEQIKENQLKIRKQFKNRKQTNQIINSRIRAQQGSKFISI